MPSFNIALGLDDKISQDVSLEIMSVEPLASGAVITFPASGSTYDDALTIVCYRAGTRIATPNGERPIEDLLEGDFVEARLAGHAPVRWIGRREVDCRRHPKPHDAWPVRVLAGAFGADLPRRDLWLSPDHSVFVDSVLVPIRYLLNDASIRQVPMDEVTYYHIELPRHDVVLAENLPAESYLDSGNRGAFANGGPSAHLHPDFALRVWKAEGCAPLVLGGPRLAAVKRRLLARAASLGFRSTNDPDIKVVADGRVLRLEAHGALRYARLPDQASNVRLTSRVWVPANMRPDEADTRALGVAISRLWLDGREASLDSPALDAGWHAPEPGWRWTDGDATLAPAGAREIVFEVAMAGPYWRADRSDQRDAA